LAKWWETANFDHTYFSNRLSDVDNTWH